MTIKDTITVLMIDDNPADLRTVDRLIASQDLPRGVRFAGAQNPDEALEEYSTSDIDLVLLDYQFPGQDGFSVLSRLREEGFETPVVMLTGQGNESVAGRAVETSLSGYLPKESLTPSRLRTCLKDHLDFNGEEPNESPDSTRTSTDTISLVSLSHLYRAVSRADPDLRQHPIGLLVFHLNELERESDSSSNELSDFIRQVIRQLTESLPTAEVARIHERTYALLFQPNDQENQSFEAVAKTYWERLSAILNNADAPGEEQRLLVKIDRNARDPSRLINRCLDQITTETITRADENNLTIREATDITGP